MSKYSDGFSNIDNNFGKDSNYDVESGGHVRANNYGIDFDTIQYLQKVYTIVSFMLGTTVLICWASMYNTAFNTWLVNTCTHWTITFLPFVFSIIPMFYIFRNRNNPEKCRIPCAIFTIAMSISVATVCAIYAAAGYRDVVILAFAGTMTIFFALTAFTFQSKIDFSFLNQIVFVGIITLIIISIFGISTYWTSGLGIFIFSCAIILDTFFLIKYGKYLNNPYMGAVNIYLDIINLFLYVLQFLSRD